MRLTLSNRFPRNKQRKKKVLLKKILFKEGIFPRKMIVRVKKSELSRKAKETFNHFRMLFNLTLPPFLPPSPQDPNFFPGITKITLQHKSPTLTNFSNQIFQSLCSSVHFVSFSRNSIFFFFLYKNPEIENVRKKKKESRSDPLI